MISILSVIIPLLAVVAGFSIERQPKKRKKEVIIITYIIIILIILFFL